MKPIRMGIRDLRSLAVRCQMLDGAAVLESDGKSALKIIEKLGYIQLDTIQVIERAHHHTLWNRLPSYTPRQLDGLLESAEVFEYWAHAFSYIPISDYRFYLPRMQSLHDPVGKWEKGRLQKYGHLLQPVLERIRLEGPQTASDMKSMTVPEPDGGVWMMHPAKAALEYLLLRGDVMVRERRRFQRVYDLTERVLPADVDTRRPSDEETGRFFVRRALTAHGVLSATDIQQHIDAADKTLLSNVLNDMLATGEVLSLEMEGCGKREYYILPEFIDGFVSDTVENKRLTILSPFDNLLYSRQRILRFFDFDYRLECYTPAEKRRFGYFALPLLWKDRFVGKLDARANRKEKTLVVNKLAFEEHFDEMDEILPFLTTALSDFCRFNRCESLQIESTTPVNVVQILQQLVTGELSR